MKKLLIILCVLLLTGCSANKLVSDMDKEHPFHDLDGKTVSLVEFKGEPDSLKDVSSNSRTVSKKEDIDRLIVFLKSGAIDRTEQTDQRIIGGALDVKFYDKNSEVVMHLSHLSKEAVSIEKDGITYIYYYETGYLDKLIQAIPYTPESE